MRFGLPVFAGSVFALVLIGCGGGGGGGSTKTTPTATPSVSVDWPTQSRNLAGPSSALSVNIVLHSTTGANPDVTIEGNRASNLTAHTETYTAASKAKVGNYTLTATFYSQASLGGVETATASANVAVSSTGALTNQDGSALGEITFSTLVKTVSISGPLQVAVGETLQATAGAEDASGNVLALTPGAFTFTVSTGGTFGTVTPDGVVTGVAVGTVSVTATADGVTSPAQSVQVNPSTAVDFVDPGFETPALGAGVWTNTPSAAPWGTTSGWGMANQATSWGTAYAGSQYAFLQGAATVNQTITGLKVGGVYEVTFWSCTRDGNVNGNNTNPLMVQANTTTILPTFSPAGPGQWTQYTTNTFTATSSSVIVTFTGVPTSPTIDETSLLDEVHLLQVG